MHIYTVQGIMDIPELRTYQQEFSLNPHVRRLDHAHRAEPKLWPLYSVCVDKTVDDVLTWRGLWAN